MARAWEAWRSAETAIADARSAVETAKADQDLLLAHLAELTALEPKAGEEVRLAGTRAAMQKGEKLAGDLEELRHVWEGSDSPLAALRSAARRLDRIASEHPLLAEALELAETRLFELRALARKHRCEVDDLPEKMREFRGSLAAAEPGAGGRDRVEFEVSTNPGAPFGPLVRIASGGELSRFVLALKVALHEEAGARTIVFDEIDRGVGGAVASAVGDRLHRLAGPGQVLVVTHSPQVAARGARHLLIEKSHDGLVTRTSVELLDAARRREEIARMLSGAQITDEARAQATRLLEAA